MKIFLIIVASLFILFIVFTVGSRFIRIRNYGKLRELEKFPESSKEFFDYVDLDNFNLYVPEESEYEGVAVSRIMDPVVRGCHFRPTAGITHRGAVIVLGGAEGSCNPLYASYLALQGYDVYAIKYFNGPDLPQFLEKVDLAYFEKVMLYVKRHVEQREALLNYHNLETAPADSTQTPDYPETFVKLEKAFDDQAAGNRREYGQGESPRELEKEKLENTKFDEIEFNFPITIVGTSKGAELALLLADTFPNFAKNLVLFAPTSHIWQGLNFNNPKSSPISSWSYHGRQIPFTPFVSMSKGQHFKFAMKIVFGHPIEFRHFYEVPATQFGQQIISVDKLLANKGKVLAFAGGDDRIWTADIGVKELKASLKNQLDYTIYPEAGHIFVGPTVLRQVKIGGTPEANYQALVDSTEKMMKFLDEIHDTCEAHHHPEPQEQAAEQAETETEAETETKA